MRGVGGGVGSLGAGWPQVRTRAGQAATWIGWIAVGLMASLVVSRLVGIDRWSRHLFTVLTLTPILLLPAWLVAIVAGLARSWALAAAAAVVAVAHHGVIVPEASGSPDTPAADSTEVGVATANLYASNDAPWPAVEEALLGADASVVALQEVTPEIAPQLDTPALLERYPHRIVDPQEGYFGSAILSGEPLAEESVESIGGLGMATASVAVGDGRVRIASVHTLQPVTGGLEPITEQLDDLGELAARWVDGPLVLAGDYNASAQHQVFREFLDTTGLTDAHRAVGRGLAVTWPARSRPPPFALLDHVVVSPDIAVTEVREFDIPGSDHRGVVAHLAIPAP